jgi:hypothetical protein
MTKSDIQSRTMTDPSILHTRYSVRAQRNLPQCKLFQVNHKRQSARHYSLYRQAETVNTISQEEGIKDATVSSDYTLVLPEKIKYEKYKTPIKTGQNDKTTNVKQKYKAS